MAAGDRFQVDGCEGLWQRETVKLGPRWELKLGGTSRTLKGVTTLKQAKAAWKAATLRADQTGDNPLPTVTKCGVLAEEFFERFQGLVNQELRSARTLKTYRSAYDLHVEPWFGNLDAQNISSEDVVDYISDRRETGVAEWTINGEVTVIRNMLKRGRRRKPKAMFHNPFDDIDEIELPKQKARKSWVRRVLRADQLDRLFEAAAPEGDYVDLFEVIALGGFRRNEGCGLLWRCIDFVDGVIHLDLQLAPLISGKEPERVTLKNGEPRQVIMLPRMEEALQRKLKRELVKGFGGADDFAFTQTNEPGRPLNPSRVSQVMAAVADEAGLGNVGPQVLRRSAASIWASAGIQREVGAQMLGHAPEVWDEHYVTPFRDKAERAEFRERSLKAGFGGLLEVSA